MSQTSTAPTEPGVPRSLDRQDDRVDQSTGLGAAMRNSVRRIRAGDLGPLPVVIGLIIIAVVFQALNPLFLSSRNLVNLSMEASALGVIALGVVCVLLVGSIDLSVGSVSGLAGAIVAVLGVSHHWPMYLAIAAAVAAGVLVGYIYGEAVTRFGMPSFVATLAGLLGVLGVQLYILGAKGTINIPFESGLVRFGQQLFLPATLAYIVAALIGVAAFITGLEKARTRRRVNLSAQSMTLIVTRAVAVLVVLEFVVWYLNRARGVAWMFLLFAALVFVMEYLFTRTSWGRSVYAVGGNAEAARRSGINVRRIYLSVFMLCTAFAAIGGVLAAARLGSANQSSGTGDVNLNAIAAAVIGGTSLFGGRGNAYSALLGIMVIASISNGLTLLNLSPSIRFMITGAVLGLAVAVDSLARRSRAAHGRE